jgi:hypothetical protein
MAAFLTRVAAANAGRPRSADEAWSASERAFAGITITTTTHGLVGDGRCLQHDARQTVEAEGSPRHGEGADRDGVQGLWAAYLRRM